MTPQLQLIVAGPESFHKDCQKDRSCCTTGSVVRLAHCTRVAQDLARYVKVQNPKIGSCKPGFRPGWGAEAARHCKDRAPAYQSRADGGLAVAGLQQQGSPARADEKIRPCRETTGSGMNMRLRGRDLPRECQSERRGQEFRRVSGNLGYLERVTAAQWP